MRNSLQSIELPSNYAQLLLQRQIEVKLQLQPIQANLCKLHELYSLGFQYYESVGNYKFRYFEIRMKELFQQQQQYFNTKFVVDTPIIQNGYKQEKIIGIGSAERIVIEAKCREEQRVQHFRQMQQRTSVKATNQQIRSLILSGDYKAIEVYTRVKNEIDFQQKMLQQKLQVRHRRSFKSNLKKGSLKMNSTQASLLSQSSRKGDMLQQIKENIFEKLIHEDDELEKNEKSEDIGSKKQQNFIFIKQGICE